jgi:intracellular sulfur oxidation DsrE/DsrF family protein
MKRVFFIATVAAVALASFGFANRAPQPYRVVFDLTSRDSLDQKAVVRWIKEVTTIDPTADVEVVMYAKGFELVMPDKSTVVADVQAAIKNPKVSFKVCAIALKNNNVDKSKLLPGVQVVPDGIHELVMKQQENWGYIKAVH